MMRATLSAAAKALETRAGRWIFWIAVAAAFLGMGVNAVIRAELPQKMFVPRLHYASPTQIAEDKDSQAEWRSSEFRGFRTIAWGEVMEGMDPYQRTCGTSAPIRRSSASRSSRSPCCGRFRSRAARCSSR